MNNTKTLYVRNTHGNDEYMVSSIKLDGFYKYTQNEQTKCWVNVDDDYNNAKKGGTNRKSKSKKTRTR